MTNPDDLANDVAESEDPLRVLCLLVAADMVEMVCGGHESAEAISDHLEAIIAAAEKRLIVETALVNWRAYEPTLQ
jgi:hypothetical protein